MNTTNELLGATLLIVLLVAIGPLLTIWSLNTLFPALNIPYDFEHWSAAIVLGAAIKSNVTKK